MLFFGLNHTSSRLLAAIKGSSFSKIRNAFPESKFVILEFAAGNENYISPQENDNYVNNEEVIEIIKFWYTSDLQFMKNTDYDSFKVLNELIKKNTSKQLNRTIRVKKNANKKNKYPIFYEEMGVIFDKFKNLINKSILSDNFYYVKADVDLEDETNTYLYAFNHTSTRFDHAVEKGFTKLSTKYPKDWIILEFGAGSINSAQYNLPEVSDYKTTINNVKKKYKVIKFWYDDKNFEFVAKENDVSINELKDALY